jgi:PKD repeat protein
LSTTTTALPFNGTTRITAQVLESAGTPPHSGTHIIFTTTLGTIQPSETETDINGQAVATFSAGTASGTATITAASGGASVGTTGALKILVGTAAVGKVIVSASPALVPALGGSSTITALVIDVNGNALTSAPVTFSTTAGVLSASLATTDQAGSAQTVLTTSTQATVTASVGAQGPTPTTPPTTGGTTPTTPTPTSGQASGTATVGVVAAPTLVITVPATTPTAGLPSSFTFVVTPAAGTSNGSAIRDLTVEWGDGQTQDLGAITGSAVVAHAYRSAGGYNISATVVDSFGNRVTAATAVVVNPRPQPTVSLTTTTTNPTAGTDVAFTASVAPAASTGTVIQDVTIDFGEPGVPKTDLGAATGTAIVLHHVYKASDTYTVVLTATDSNGGVGTAVTTVFVQAATPLGVSLTFTKTIVDPSNTLVTFTATVTGLGNAVVTQYLWNFGDGQSQTTTTGQVTHNYTKPSPPLVASVTITTSNNGTAIGTTPITP